MENFDDNSNIEEGSDRSFDYKYEEEDIFEDWQELPDSYEIAAEPPIFTKTSGIII